MTDNHLDPAVYERGLFDDEPVPDLIDETNDWLEEKTAEWHGSHSELQLYEYLGMSWDEYKRWVINYTQVPIHVINRYLGSH